MNDFINVLGRGIDKVTTFTVGFLLGALTMIAVGTGLLQIEIEKGKKERPTYRRRLNYSNETEKES